MARQTRVSALGLLLAIAALHQAARWLVTPSPTAFVQVHQAGVPRREALFGAAAAALAVAPSAAWAAIKPCPDGANNCFSSASPKGKNYVAPWVWPAGTSRDEAVKALRVAIEAYPQEGQSEVDLGGWSFAVDELASKGYARLEYKSGLGNFARWFNGGKPFIDDFEVEVGDKEVSVRSSSRVGDSDLGVNAKRINYIAASLRTKGWTAPGVV